MNAIWNGAEFSPPTYDLILHYVFRAAGAGLPIARLPSICAILAAAALVAYLVGKRLGVLLGALAFALILNSALFDHAIQARAYALLAALLAVGLALCAGGLSCGVWLPLIRRHAGFNANDSASPEFYGGPTLGHLVEHAH